MQDTGVSTMQSMTADLVFWPGMAFEIAERQVRCRECIYRAPSQPLMPAQRPSVPDYPFSHQCADFFHADGFYLVLCD